jgi:predicted ArsR family transcriptional regulator
MGTLAAMRCTVALSILHTVEEAHQLMTENTEAILTPLQGLAHLAAMIYHYFAAEAVATLGEQEGAELIARTIRKMGEERGRRIRARVDEAGLEPTLENMSKFYDLPIGQAWEARYEKVGEGHHIETVTHCPFAELWQDFHAEELAMHYCEIDMAIIAGYNPHIKIQRHKSLLKGDGCCVYEYRTE